jgi:hypothetical protein
MHWNKSLDYVSFILEYIPYFIRKGGILISCPFVCSSNIFQINLRIFVEIGMNTMPLEVIQHL